MQSAQLCILLLSLLALVAIADRIDKHHRRGSFDLALTRRAHRKPSRRGSSGHRKPSRRASSGNAANVGNGDAADYDDASRLYYPAKGEKAIPQKTQKRRLRALSDLKVAQSAYLNYIMLDSSGRAVHVGNDHAAQHQAARARRYSAQREKGSGQSHGYGSRESWDHYFESPPDQSHHSNPTDCTARLPQSSPRYSSEECIDGPDKQQTLNQNWDYFPKVRHQHGDGDKHGRPKTAYDDSTDSESTEQFAESESTAYYGYPNSARYRAVAARLPQSSRRYISEESVDGPNKQQTLNQNWDDSPQVRHHGDVGKHQQSKTPWEDFLQSDHDDSTIFFSADNTCDAFKGE